MQARQGRIRKDWHHRVTGDPCKRFGTVVLEQLDIKSMTASAKGTLANPGCVRLTDVSVVGESPTERKGSHHFHREPCACHREVSGEASVAACAGQAIEPRNRLCRMRRDFPGNRRQHFSAAFG